MTGAAWLGSITGVRLLLVALGSGGTASVALSPGRPGGSPADRHARAVDHHALGPRTAPHPEGAHEAFRSGLSLYVETSRRRARRSGFRRSTCLRRPSMIV